MQGLQEKNKQSKQNLTKKQEDEILNTKKENDKSSNTKELIFLPVA